MKWFQGWILTLALMLVAGAAQAAVTPNAVVTTQTPNRGIVQFLQGTDSAAAYKTLYTAGSNGSKIVGMFATSNDPSATHLLTCQIVNSTVKYGGMAITLPTNAGFANGTAQINLMSPANWVGLPLDSDGNPFFYMASGDTLQCTFATAITASDVLNIILIAADF